MLSATTALELRKHSVGIDLSLEAIEEGGSSGCCQLPRIVSGVQLMSGSTSSKAAFNG